MKPIYRGTTTTTTTTTPPHEEHVGVVDTKKYFFVLYYNEETEVVRLVPMEPRGTMMGQRQGRPRYVCMIGTTDENFTSDYSYNYQVVTATMVMKTLFVAQEAWDIEE